MQKFLCKIGCALQREQSSVLILAAWGLYLYVLLGGKLQGNAVYLQHRHHRFEQRHLDGHFLLRE